jgi:glycosyltransferase involved in cell wall biosynthesis
VKICYLADAGSIHVRRWVEHFAGRGHEVHLISYRPWTASDIPDVGLYLLKMSPLPVNLLLHVAQIRRWIREIKPEILHAHYIYTYGFLASLTAFRPVILSAWGSDIMVTPRKSMIGRLRVRHALAKADLVLTTSQNLKEQLHNTFAVQEHKVKAIPWGNDLAIFHKGYETEADLLRTELGIDPKSYVIMSPRHCIAHYRIENIVRALPYIITEHPDTVLILLRGSANDMEYEKIVDQLAAGLGVKANIRWIQRELTPQEMAALYNISDALVSIPISDQFASSIQEGMVCGIVPVVGKLDVYSQYLNDGENALFVDADDPRDIAGKIIYIIQHPELKEIFYEINKKIVEEKEDWSKNSVKMEELYLEIPGRQTTGG